MAEQIAIIGAGPGGYAAALRASSLGAKVTLVEREGVGGTCLNWGCIPSKIMKTTADLLLKFNEAQKYGINVQGPVALDMVALMARKQALIQTQQQGILSLLKKGRVTVLMGRAKIKAMGLLTVTDDSGTRTEIAFDRLILATGTIPLNVPAFAFNGRTILSSNDLLSLKQIPPSIIIVGGGVIGCEFAFILAALGSAVTVVEAMDRLLPLDSVDTACSKLLLREMKKRKIKVILDRSVTTCEPHDRGVSVMVGASPFSNLKTGATVTPVKIEVSAMAVCIGRTPLSKDLGLEAIGLKTDGQGWIPVNDAMETTIKGVYAIGDITGPANIMLAHVATHEAMVAAENATGGTRTMSYNAVPNAIFTMPEIGTVGLSEEGCQKKGIDAQCFTVNFRAIGKAQVMGEIAGEAKIVLERPSGRVLGLHLIGPHATDLIAEGALAVKKGLTISDLAETIHAHPTLAEIVSELALKATGKALHG
ncbi:LpdA [Desulforapulum autotrophicum HRM2]|uniref:Dihydrolipoyl dehydrogenase n=1 Tax=Desulforapulum autotrophicum (strain ATCC 43914 / DSM 3382 / VKM B-1955 / HRM2) TaxID=177437 RepID=C0QGU6_DESAH|nr:dihydrolipoyl dehydrogenase [Desulforapulum autotrophicum]ACN15595.1 LpdA [Desulforapulum autotrophicum HRM2]